MSGNSNSGRRAGFRHTQRTREKIKAGVLVDRMFKIAMGEIEATTQQVNAAKTLLGKVLPDLSAVEVDAELSGEVGVRSIKVEGVSTQNT